MADTSETWQLGVNCPFKTLFNTTVACVQLCLVEYDGDTVAYLANCLSNVLLTTFYAILCYPDALC